MVARSTVPVVEVLVQVTCEKVALNFSASSVSSAVLVGVPPSVTK